MSVNIKNHYQILGVSLKATTKEIKTQYKQLIKKNHPDRFKGLRAKYEADGDEILLEILKDKILQAEEDCKLINDAYKILSNPKLRKNYDEKLNKTTVPVSKIIVSPTNIDFGILSEGQKKSKSFTIQNKGGPAVAVDINWENKPDWGEIIIEPDPDKIFPIKVTVEIDTTKSNPGSKSQKVLINVDGQNYVVSIQLTIKETLFSVPVPPTTTKPTLSKSTKTKPTLTSFVLWFGFAIIVLGFAFGIIANNTMDTTPYKQLEDDSEQINTIAAEKLESDYTQINSQASRSDLEKELSLFVSNPDNIISFERLIGIYDCDSGLPSTSSRDLCGKYLITNHSKFSRLSLPYYYSQSCNIIKYTYQSKPVENNVAEQLFIPGMTLELMCHEYYFSSSPSYEGWEWRKKDMCFYSYLKNQVGEKEMKKCFTLPLVNLKPSELVEITAKRLPVPNSLEYTGLVKFKIRVDEKSISPMGILKITTIPVPEQELGRYHGYIDGLYQENKQDNRILDDTISEFLPGNTYIVYAYLLDGYVPNKVCFELSVAYSQNEQVCVNIP